ncbi:hypothetical protein M0638_14030 [Roseomonas sp. NAR14]|uniref:Uncharacterized protein n=1 Tax=Roseomonas acroporae TaxID=2937791 RepID=A0A9X2BX26_9PROT|nr:PGPGW domain-containing protein [Roseomonas acroporae]MCK8785504.1 hypothetical protein [Roseomonas acroporae]
MTGPGSAAPGDASRPTAGTGAPAPAAGALVPVASAGRPSLKRKLAGWSLLVLGVLGCVLPFLQGFLFLALGVFVLRHQYGWASNGMRWLERRFPRQVQGIEGMEARLAERLKGWGRRVKRAFGRA